MNNQFFSSDSSLTTRKTVCLLIQFFLIIFVYHTMKDLKDSVVITGSQAGAEVIPFIKIWGMLPLAVGASYLFSVIYNRFGRETALHFFTSSLLLSYLAFAFILYPAKDALYLEKLDNMLQMFLPAGCRGFIAMLCNWHFTLFYLTSELWSVLILSILFYGYVNETTTLSDAKKFYPLCMFTGNFAGILSGQSSLFLSHSLQDLLSWEQTLQVMISVVAVAGVLIMAISRFCLDNASTTASGSGRKPKTSVSFTENIKNVARSGPLLCITALVVGFGLSSNLIEVVWKENIRELYPDPRAYNAFINQITFFIGVSAVVMALFSRFLFQMLRWGKVALITPVTLFLTSSLFFLSLLIPEEITGLVAEALGMTPLLLVVVLGSLHYVLGMTAKYTLFDSCKEMAFLSIDSEERMRAKSVIDSMGSRLGKTGSSCILQVFLIAFGSTAGHLSIIAAFSLLVIAASIAATKRLSGYLQEKTNEDGLVEEPLVA